MEKIKWLPGFLCLITACSHVNVNPPAADSQTAMAEADSSSVEIAYVLGHNHRKFFAQAHAELVTAQSFLDQKIVTKTSVNPSHYHDFLQKVSNFMARGPELGSIEDCKAPFTVTIKTRSNSKTVSGCRTADESAFSNLVNEGEFLLYTRK